MVSKICSKCRIEKPGNEFGKSAKHAHGLQSYCKTCTREVNRQWYETNKELKNTKNKQWMSVNRESFNAYQKNWYQKNKSAHIKKCMARNKRKYHSDPEYRLLSNLRKRLSEALRGGYKRGRTVELIGMAVPELLVYLNLDCLDKYGVPYTGNESRFHIDHIRPLSAFNLRNPEEAAVACHWTNLQILTVRENLTKSDRCA